MIKSILLFLVLSTTSAHAVLMLAYEGRLDKCATIDEVFGCALISTTSTPTLSIVDDEVLASDDSLVQLSDEVNGLSESQDMVNKYARHYEVTNQELIDAVLSLENSELGLNFENLNSVLK